MSVITYYVILYNNIWFRLCRFMVNKRFACLLEANKRGFTLKHDPSGAQNRCFYRCMAVHLAANEDEVVDMVIEFMLANQFVTDVDEVIFIGRFSGGCSGCDETRVIDVVTTWGNMYKR